MVQLVGYLAETIIDLTPDEANHLAYTASSQAHALDDFRYNGLANAQTADMLSERETSEKTTTARNAWADEKPKREAQQQRWREIATLLNPEHYPEGWTTHG